MHFWKLSEFSERFSVPFTVIRCDQYKKKNNRQKIKVLIVSAWAAAEINNKFLFTE